MTGKLGLNIWNRAVMADHSGLVSLNRTARKITGRAGQLRQDNELRHTWKGSWERTAREG
jgi:hypothetical protein